MWEAGRALPWLCNLLNFREIIFPHFTSEPWLQGRIALSLALAQESTSMGTICLFEVMAMFKCTAGSEPLEASAEL